MPSYEGFIVVLGLVKSFTAYDKGAGHEPESLVPEGSLFRSCGALGLRKPVGLAEQSAPKICRLLPW